jgi:hypothetical protein
LSTASTRLREAIITRLDAPVLLGYGAVRRTPVAPLQPSDLPALTVYVISESLTPDGDGNAGELRFIATSTIGISLVRGFTDPATLDASIDVDLDKIETGLFTDPSFVHFGADGYFESISNMTRRRLYPQSGETYFAELRLEISFVNRIGFDPVIPDHYKGMSLTTNPLNNPDAPKITTVINEPDWSA